MHFKLKNGIKWCYFTLSKYAIIILNNLVNTARRMEEEKNTDRNVFYVVFLYLLIQLHWEIFVTPWRQ